MKFSSLLQGPLRMRGDDDWGSGAFNAPRGERKHRGIDIITSPGEEIYCPIDGRIVRVAEPYDDEPRYNGLLLAGSGSWEGYEIKLFYLDGFSLGPIEQGALMARSEDISIRYPGITNHVHLEVRRDGDLLDPTSFFDFQQDFA